jgi:hypothetical protein
MTQPPHKLNIMKKSYILLSSILILALVTITNVVFAQAPGPSDVTTAAPTTIAGADKILCAGGAISISGPQDASNHDYTKYHWYKLDASSNPIEVTGNTTKTYTETATNTAGYYYYKLVTENSTGCISPMSAAFKIYVLPPLSVSITTPTSEMCAIASNSIVLTANPTPSTGFDYTYQWTRDGVDIPSATGPTYTVTGETTATTAHFGVRISYTLNSSCPATATKDIVLDPIPTTPVITAN